MGLGRGPAAEAEMGIEMEMEMGMEMGMVAIDEDGALVVGPAQRARVALANRRRHHP